MEKVGGAGSSPAPILALLCVDKEAFEDSGWCQAEGGRQVKDCLLWPHRLPAQPSLIPLGMAVTRVSLGRLTQLLAAPF